MPTLLELSGVTVRFGGLVALDNVSLEVPRGQVVGVIGPNGAGKTTLFNVVCGFLRPQEGSVRWQGRELTGHRPHHLAGLGVARTLQGLGLFPGLTVLQNVMTGATRHARTGVPSALPALPRTDRDEAAGVRAAVAHLTALGHRRIAHLAGPQGLSTGHGRYRAFLDAVARPGPSPGPIAFADAFTEAAGRSAARELLAARPRPTAVVAGNDLLAIGLLDTLESAGLRCPDDVSVVGFNDIPMLSRMTPPLTTVRIPQREIGGEAARLLLDLMTEPGSAKLLLLPTRLIERASTAPPAAAID